MFHLETVQGTRSPRTRTRTLTRLGGVTPPPPSWQPRARWRLVPLVVHLVFTVKQVRAASVTTATPFTHAGGSLVSFFEAADASSLAGGLKWAGPDAPPPVSSPGRSSPRGLSSRTPPSTSCAPTACVQSGRLLS